MADDLEGMLQLPAVAAVVLEAGQVPAEVRTLLEETVAAESILQVGVNLHFLGKLQRFDLDESSCHRLHVALRITEGDAAGSDRIFVAIGVNSCVDDSTEQVVENMGQTLSVKHSVERPDEHSFLRV